MVGKGAVATTVGLSAFAGTAFLAGTRHEGTQRSSLRAAATQRSVQQVPFSGNASSSSSLSTAAAASAGIALSALAAGGGRKLVCSKPSQVCLRAFESELGVQPPVGFWDPAGFTVGGDAASFRRRRFIELKHGRVAMFACLGYIVPEYYRWPGELSPSLGLKFTDVPTGFAAFQKVPLSGWAQMVAFAGTVELFQYVDDPKRPPGDFENAGALGVPNGFLKISDPESKKKKLSAEIANGRLAMMAIIGMFFQDGLTGSAWGDWANYTDSPLRAFESELGVQAPVGFWDPLGLSADGDVDNFKRRRAVELKHGRICMLACIGYIVPEYFRWPGYLSPAQGLKFTDVPHGIAAISKVPLEGWLQIGLFLGHYEGQFFRQSANRAPGDFEGYGFLGVGKNFIFNFDPIIFKDEETRKKKLSAEIANGRLAMVALMAMLFQNGTVGTTGPEMWLPASAFENELGVQPPVGFWDPAGFTADGDPKEFYRRRLIEIKHGRVSMLACLGYITQQFVQFPGYLSPSSGIKFADVPNGLNGVTKVPAVGWFQYTVFCGICELWLMHQVPENPPGKLCTRLWGEGATNYGYGSIGVPNYLGGKSIDDPELKKKKLNAELANGRLAMMAIIGMFFQDGLTGSAWGDWANYTDSPLRAFESELGVQAPVGFWDPLGLSADGDVDNFKRRRAVELKHGRICMLACIGYIVPEYFRWPGYLSPAQGLKFTDVPHGIAAISKVPLEGWLQIGLFLGHYEGQFFRQSPNRAPGDFEGYGFLGVGKNFIFNFDPIIFKDEETKKKKLSAEIANGRLAMVALMAMLFQNGTVGTTGPEMWLPASAFENELGVQPPVGFWDPAGFTADGDPREFYRRRLIEIKHGRVSMLACLGYITQQFVQFPGYLSPSSGIKFADVPNGLNGVTKVPAVGWFQYTVFCGICELWLMHQVPENPPGKLCTRLWGEGATNYGYGSIGVPNYLGGKSIDDPELKKKKLNAELANGRLAMMAIIGMFFQDGLTGSAWGDWANYTDSPLRS